jgi:Tol biopolymer transport system component
MLTAGTRIASYEILGSLGAGGMGEVYRARDSRLNRDVAIKVLIPAVANDPDRLARFGREAQVLAALNHPNIAHIHGLEDSSGVPALVMELVDGETLAERIARAPVPPADALAIARQIADALDAAHEKGIVHRDLKPSNIKIRDDGTAKILDFGLAKALDVNEREAPGDRPSASLSPTLTAPTQLGVILGTAAYMAPEQARGKPADKRADIWAFGAVLYEMFTGQRAFAADEISDTLALVLTKEPDWTALPAGTPPACRKLLRRCLDKDRKRRLADIADARFEIDEAAREDAAATTSAAASTSVTMPPTAPARDALRRILPWSVAAVAIAAAVLFVAMWAPWRSAAPSPPVRVTSELGAPILRGTSPGKALEISRSGDTLAFVGEPATGPPELYIRRLHQLIANRAEGTRGAMSPFFSPDGQWVGYFAENKLKKVSVTGGASITLCDAAGARGGSWSEDGTIVFMAGVTDNSGGGSGRTMSLNRVSASGGQPEAVTTLTDGEITHRWPQMLNGGRAVLYTASTTTGGYEGASIVAQRLPNGPRIVIVRGGYHGRYVASGHLLYMHEGTLFAMPFDLATLSATGPAVPAVEGVRANAGTAAAHFSVSDSGTLAYIPGEGPESNAPIVWLNRDGKVEPLRATPVNWNNIQFAPDGRRVAFDVRGPQTDVWTYDWQRQTPMQLTFAAADDSNPIWSPDGRDIAFASRRAGVANVYVQHADGTGDAVRLTTSQSTTQVPSSWHASGKFIAFTETQSASTGQDLMILPLERDGASGWKPGKPYPFLVTPAAEFDAVFSPDGRWVVYTSTESGLPDIYVRPFPGPGGKWKVSTEIGARFAVWSRSSNELLFRTADARRLMVVSYTVEGDSFRADGPRLWAEGTFGRPNGQRGFDLHPDGRRVATVAGPRGTPEAASDTAVFVFNFLDELRRIAPPKQP